MTSKAICRISKLKHKGNIGAMGQHVSRDRETTNAMPGVENVILHGGGNYIADYESRMTELAIPRIRKNAVLAVDFFLGASPDHFMTNGVRDDDKVADFVVVVQDWLTKNWGSNFVGATLHLDETTPHVHALVIPEHGGKLSASHFFDGRKKMQDLQNSFALACKPLGLERGTKGSKAKHKSIKQYYAEVVKIESLTEKLNAALHENQQLRARLEPFLAREVDAVIVDEDFEERLARVRREAENKTADVEVLKDGAR